MKEAGPGDRIQIQPSCMLTREPIPFPGFDLAPIEKFSYTHNHGYSLHHSLPISIPSDDTGSFATLRRIHLARDVRNGAQTHRMRDAV